MSTPRTDKEAFDGRKFEKCVGEFVDANFARQLEEELYQCKVLIKELQEYKEYMENKIKSIAEKLT